MKRVLHKPSLLSRPPNLNQYNYNMTMNTDFNLESQNDLFLPEETFDITKFVNDNNLNADLPTSPPSNIFYEDSKSFFQVPFPSTGPPIRGDFSGECNFEISLSGSTTDRKKFMYSHKLNRVFLNMLAEMPVQFKWDWDVLQHCSLWLRATLILSGNEQQESRVLRCHNHRVKTDPSNSDIPDNLRTSNMLAHVLRSARLTPEVVYCGKEEDDRQWLSVAIPMSQKPAEGADVFNYVYKFCCKHSCISGINRRRVEVLFTLEDANGQVYGRKSLGVRVCSCPRRDMDKEEKEMRGDSGPPSKKRALSHSNHNLPKVVAPVSADNNVYNLNLKINGLKNYTFMVKAAYDRMAGELMQMQPNHPDYSEYKQRLLEYMELMNQVTHPCNPK